MKISEKVAIICQVQVPPERNGTVKPMKPGGYSDSGADIGYALRRQQVEVITPIEDPAVKNDFDWVFPDTKEGIQAAIDKGATVIWLNTVLYEGHPVEQFLENGISVVGQDPGNVDMYDDKLVTNELLRNHHLPVPASVVITHENADRFQLDLPFPVVVKPVRGRGSQGVSLVTTGQELTAVLHEMFANREYGTVLYAEEFLPGEEVTITVLPPGVYEIDNKQVHKTDHWSLPPVKRFNHENGVAPYNGTVAVINNSEVLDDEALNSEAMQQLCKECEEAARLVNARAPIRIDCRANAKGDYLLFDLNMKPNMTGASRPHRNDQDSLTALAARKIGWTFDELILNILNQHWRK